MHLRTQCNYLSSLLGMHPLPGPEEEPYIISGWRSWQKRSPYRIVYGSHFRGTVVHNYSVSEGNPAWNGLVLTATEVIPNFSWTPRLALAEESMMTLLACPKPSDVLIFPSVNCLVVRVFYTGDAWYVATTRALERINQGIAGLGSVGGLLQRCLAQHCKRRLCSGMCYWSPNTCQTVEVSRRFTSGSHPEYIPGRTYPAVVWFFGLLEDPCSMLHLGTCATVPHEQIERENGMVDLDFSVHRFLAPCVPILPDPEMQHVLDVYDPEHLTYSEAGNGLKTCVQSMTWDRLYDGLFLVNPITMFALRLCTPDVVFLTPYLQGEQDAVGFLIHRVVEATNMESSRLPMDRMSRLWWSNMVGGFLNEFFGHTHTFEIQQICWQVEMMPRWIASWMNQMACLCWTEWNQLDLDLQRLYLLLDYASEDCNWIRILKHPKYTDWVAKAVMHFIHQGGEVDEA